MQDQMSAGSVSVRTYASIDGIVLLHPHRAERGTGTKLPEASFMRMLSLPTWWPAPRSSTSSCKHTEN